MIALQIVGCVKATSLQEEEIYCSVIFLPNSLLTTNALTFPVVVDFFPNGAKFQFFGEKKKKSFSLLFFWGEKILYEDLVWVPLKLFGQFVF